MSIINFAYCLFGERLVLMNLLLCNYIVGACVVGFGLVEMVSIMNFTFVDN